MVTIEIASRHNRFIPSKATYFFIKNTNKVRPLRFFTIKMFTVTFILLTVSRFKDFRILSR